MLCWVPRAFLVLVLLVASFPRPAPGAEKPKFFLVIHGHKIGQHLAAWGPTITAALRSGRYSEVHVVSNIADLIPPHTDPVTGTVYVPHKILNPNQTSDHNSISLDFFSTESWRQAASDLQDIRDVMRWMEKQGQKPTAESVLAIIDPPAGQKAPELPAARRLIASIADERARIGELEAGERAAELEHFLTNIKDDMGRILRFDEHMQTVEKALAKAGPGDVIVRDHNFVMSKAEGYDASFDAAARRRARVIVHDVNEIGSLAPRTVEQHGQDIVRQLADQPGEPGAFPSSYRWSEAQQRAVFQAAPSAEHAAATAVRMRALFGGEPGSYELVNLSAESQGWAVKSEREHFLALVRERLIATAGPLVLAPWGVPNDPEWKRDLAALALEFPGRVLDASAIHDDALYAQLIRGAKRFLTPDTGPAWWGRSLNPDATTTVLLRYDDKNTPKDLLRFWHSASANFVVLDPDKPARAEAQRVSASLPIATCGEAAGTFSGGG